MGLAADVGGPNGQRRLRHAALAHVGRGRRGWQTAWADETVIEKKPTMCLFSFSSFWGYIPSGRSRSRKVGAMRAELGGSTGPENLPSQSQKPLDVSANNQS